MDFLPNLLRFSPLPLLILLALSMVGCGGSSSQAPAQNASVFYFQADDGVSGTELWRTEGTPQSTRRVADINTREQGSQPEQLVDFNGALYFLADDGKTGQELWKYDFASGQTSRVSNISSSKTRRIKHLTATANFLYFSADDGASGRELWRSDGSTAGTQLVADLVPGPGHSAPGDLMPANDRLFFSALNANSSRRLWVTDGSAAGTIELLDIDTVEIANITRAALIRDWDVIGGRLYFLLSTLSSEQSLLWVSDGTPAGTIRLDQAAGFDWGFPTSITRVGERLFVAQNPAFGEAGLWVSDGSVLGTQSLGALGVYHPVAVGDRLFFFNQPSGVAEIWVSNGTLAGTFSAGTFDLGSGPLNEISIAEHDGDLYFLLSKNIFFLPDGGLGIELWRSTGTPGGTTLIRRISSPLVDMMHHGLFSFDSRLVFSVIDENLQQALWTSDGSQAGTRQIVDLQSPDEDRDRNLSPDIELTVTANWLDVIAANGRLYFAAERDESGLEPWTSDVFGAGLRQLGNINRSTQSSLLQDFSRLPIANLGDLQLFAANDGEHGFELWRTDGTEAGTRLLQDIAVGPTSAHPRPLAVLNGQLLFAVDAGESDVELWRSNGNPSGTSRIKRLSSEREVFSHQFESLGNRFYFVAEDEINGRELWRTDIALQSAELLHDVVDGPESSSPRVLTAHGGRLYFIAAGAGGGEFLWASDGQPDGLQQIAAFNRIHALLSFDGQLYVVAESDPGFSQLWRYDNGSLLVLDDVSTASDFRSFTFFGITDSAMFISENGLLERDLKQYASNGRMGGLVSLTNTVAGAEFDILFQQIANGFSINLDLGDIDEVFAMQRTAALDDVFLFSGNDASGQGREPWLSDGTLAGTRPLLDIRSGALSSHPSILGRHEGNIYFTADDGVTGRELWISDGTAGGTRLLSDINPGSDSAFRPYD